jgi:hypothetical protein
VRDFRELAPVVGGDRAGSDLALLVEQADLLLADRETRLDQGVIPLIVERIILRVGVATRLGVLLDQLIGDGLAVKQAAVLVRVKDVLVVTRQLLAVERGDERTHVAAGLAAALSEAPDSRHA